MPSDLFHTQLRMYFLHLFSKYIFAHLYGIHFSKLMASGIQPRAVDHKRAVLFMYLRLLLRCFTFHNRKNGS